MYFFTVFDYLRKIVGRPLTNNNSMTIYNENTVFIEISIKLIES